MDSGFKFEITFKSHFYLGHSLGDDISKTSKYLSAFQVEKFTYMFNVFFDKHGGDGIIQKEDINELLEMFRSYCGYEKTNPRYLRMVDVMGAFYDCMVEHVTQEKMRNAEAEGFDTVSNIFVLNGIHFLIQMLYVSSGKRP